MNKQQVKFFLPMVSEFCNNIQNYKGLSKIPGLFLPHVLENYGSAERKYFYVGRDTNGWEKFSKLIQQYKSSELVQYFDENNSWPNVNDFLEYANNKAGGFFTFVTKLHLRLHGVNEDVAANPELDDKYKKLLTEIGWGNINSIETPDSLKRREEWENINKDTYWAVKKYSRIFDRVTYILDIYKPDYIFIFNWDWDAEEFYFKDIKANWIKSEYDETFISTYSVDGYKTKIIWTIHPQRMSYLGMNSDKLLAEILKRL